MRSTEGDLSAEARVGERSPGGHYRPHLAVLGDSDLADCRIAATGGWLVVFAVMFVHVWQTGPGLGRGREPVWRRRLR